MGSTLRMTLVGIALLAAACGGGSSEPATPTADTGAPATPPPESGPPAGGAESAAPAAAEPPAAPAPKAIKDVIGTPATIDVKAGKASRSYVAQPDIDAILTAIGTDQSPSGPKRKCPDDVTVSFKDDSGAEKGVLGICGGLGPKDKLEGAEFGATQDDRAGINLADAGALKKALSKKPAKAKKPTPAAASAGAGDKGVGNKKKK